MVCIFSKMFMQIYTNIASITKRNTVKRNNEVIDYFQSPLGCIRNGLDGSYELKRDKRTP